MGSYNREIARRVVDALTSLGLDAELLVPEDEDISLKERCRRVNRVCSQRSADVPAYSSSCLRTL